MPRSSAGVDHVRQIGGIQTATVGAGRRTWANVDPAHISESWAEQSQALAQVVLAAQQRAAAEGSGYAAAVLAEQGSWVAPEAFVDPSALAGWAPDGRTLQGLLNSPAITAKGLIGKGFSAQDALLAAGQGLDVILSSLMADTSRQAASIDIATRDGVGWVRMVNPPCCDRCAILAGRFYRWNDGFLRHPRCDCIHRPATARSLAGARSEGLVQDPYEYFRSLSPAEQDRIFTRAGAQAIREGADIGRVVNARRGMTPNGMFTSEGMGKRGFARQQLKPGQRRLTPEGLAQMYPDRGEYLAALREHGYLIPGGQDPLGSLKGAWYEGYGELGRGGTRKAATTEVVRAREAGIRSGSRYTMTAAERRLYDAQTQWAAVLKGRNPWGKGPLTPQIAAAVEKNYRNQLATSGHVFATAEDAVAQAQSITVRAAAGGAGGSGSGLPPAPAGSAGDDWLARQRALGAFADPAKVGRLEPGEVEFLERFVAAGQQAEWIRKLPHLPTNDFRWLNRAEAEFELKTITGTVTYAKVHGRIVDAASRAAKHAFVKDRFVIDIGDVVLTDALIRELADFNVGRRKYRIRELWVMARGRLVQIPLNT